MSRLAAIGMRGAVAAAGGAAIISGLVFAFQGDPAAPSETAQADFVVASGTPMVTPEVATAASTATAAPANETTQSEVPAPLTTPANVPTAGPRPMTQVVAPAPTPMAPITDTPKYTDLAVLGLAADVFLPSGRTFRECVELPPSHEKWPTPVHLYYEGKGKWLVETHVSEVQVVFDEATATFSTRNFAPTSPDCR